MFDKPEDSTIQRQDCKHPWEFRDGNHSEQSQEKCPTVGAQPKIFGRDQPEGVVMDDGDTKSELPIHLILGASEYSWIKTDTKPRIGKATESIAELCRLERKHT